jgi:hypothetical protein
MRRHEGGAWRPIEEERGLLTLDSLDGHVTQLDGTTVCGYRLVWRRCD